MRDLVLGGLFLECTHTHTQLFQSVHSCLSVISTPRMFRGVDCERAGGTLSDQVAVTATEQMQLFVFVSFSFPYTTGSEGTLRY